MKQKMFDQCAADARVEARRMRFLHGRAYARHGTALLSDETVPGAQMSELEEYALSWAYRYFRNNQVAPSDELFTGLAVLFMEAYRLPVGEEL